VPHRVHAADRPRAAVLGYECCFEAAPERGAAGWQDKRRNDRLAGMLLLARRWPVPRLAQMMQMPQKIREPWCRVIWVHLQGHDNPTGAPLNEPHMPHMLPTRPPPPHAAPHHHHHQHLHHRRRRPRPRPGVTSDLRPPSQPSRLGGGAGALPRRAHGTLGSCSHVQYALGKAGHSSHWPGCRRVQRCLAWPAEGAGPRCQPKHRPPRPHCAAQMRQASCEQAPGGHAAALHLLCRRQGATPLPQAGRRRASDDYHCCK
jgi:hypothetical protein